jgi:superfamily II DNA or RNA helicase
MEYDLTISKINEVFVHVTCDRSVAKELSEYFSFRVPGYQFVPAFKNKLWDGYIRLFNLQTNNIYHGLIDYIKIFATERNYSINIDPEITITKNFSVNEANEFVKLLNLPVEPRDYQIKGFVDAIRMKRILIVSPTASGKSLLLYMITRFIKLNHKKGILIVPTTSLVEQMYSDFKSYGWDVEKYCHKQYQGKDKVTDKFLTITTWQSIYTLPQEYFEQFDFVLGDEAHLFKAKSLTTIMSSLIHADYRIGCTGTLDGTKTHKLVLEGLFGMSKKTVDTKQLMEQKILAELMIKCLVLKYPEVSCKLVRQMDYQSELDYIVSNTARNEFIKNLAVSLNGNSLILYQFVEKHGQILYNMISEVSKERKVFFIHGSVETDEREQVRAITEKENNAIIIASYGTFSTGINIVNLHNIIFSSPSKSRIRNLQSIGRGLRKGNEKESAVLFDIVDDFRVGKFTNFTLNHFIERVKIYEEEKFKYKIYNIELKNG